MASFQRIVKYLCVFTLCFFTRVEHTHASELVSIRVGKIQAHVQIASTLEQRRIGLMHRRSLKKDEGMLFIFEKAKILSFWMKNTPLPLDIGFFDSERILLNYISMRPLDDKTVHRSTEPAVFALEMSQGWFDSNDILIGARLMLPKRLEE